MNSKTWCYWQNFFHDRLVELDKTLPRYDDTEFSIWPYLSKKRREEIVNKYHTEANQACKDFIENGCWGKDLPTNVKCAILGRIEEAYDFCLNLYILQGPRTRVVIRPPDIKITPLNVILTFFLIDMHRR